MNQITTDELKKRIDAGTAYVLDVRSELEFASGHVQGAHNIPHTALATRMAELPRDKPIFVHCQMGGRAQFAAQLLVASGYDVYCVAPGGMGEWSQKGYPTNQRG